jgi:hypothetical protein
MPKYADAMSAPARAAQLRVRPVVRSRTSGPAAGGGSRTVFADRGGNDQRGRAAAAEADR